MRGPSKEKGWLRLKNLELPSGFQRRVFTGKFWGDGCRVCDFILIGCWWGNSIVFQEPQSSAFWFQPVRVHVFVLSFKSPSSTRVRAIFPVEELRDTYQVVMYIPSGGIRSLHYCFLTAFPLFLHSLPSLISNCLNLLFGTQGRSKRLKLFSYKQEMWGHRKAFVPRRAHMFLLSFR